jgi:heme oxygenase
MRARVLEKLQAETRALCGQTEEAALRFVEDGCAERYRDYLVRCYGFEAPVESACAMSPTLASHGATTRPRTRYIAQDLVDLGMPPERLLELKPCPLAPFKDISEALGWLYVIERNVVTNSLCHARLVESAPALAAQARYLNCYGPTTLMHWRAFGVSLERAASHADADLIANAAIDCFGRLYDWLQIIEEPFEARIAASS